VFADEEAVSDSFFNSSVSCIIFASILAIFSVFSDFWVAFDA